MSTAKVIEIIAESDTSWEEAARNALATVSQTIKNVRSLYVQDMQAVVKDNQIVSFRLNAKITFVVDQTIE